MTDVLNRTDVREQIVNVLVDYTKNESLRDIGDETQFDEVGLDSLSLFHFILAIEDHFSFRISDSNFSSASMKSLGSLLDVLCDFLFRPI